MQLRCQYIEGSQKCRNPIDCNMLQIPTQLPLVSIGAVFVSDREQFPGSNSRMAVGSSVQHTSQRLEGGSKLFERQAKPDPDMIRDSE